MSPTYGYVWLNAVRNIFSDVFSTLTISWACVESEMGPRSCCFVVRQTNHERPQRLLTCSNFLSSDIYSIFSLTSQHRLIRCSVAKCQLTIPFQAVESAALLDGVSPCGATPAAAAAALPMDAMASGGGCDGACVFAFHHCQGRPGYLYMWRPRCSLAFPSQVVAHWRRSRSRSSLVVRCQYRTHALVWRPSSS